MALDNEDSSWLIVIRKRILFTCNPHPFYNFLYYHRLSPLYYAFMSFVSERGT